MNKEKIIAYTDGGARGNPGPAGIGVAIKSPDGMAKTYSQSIGVRTNNEAEYEAVIFALQKIKSLFGKDKAKKLEIEIRMDSELVARQLGGKYKVSEAGLVPLYIKAHNSIVDFEAVSFTEIPRENNAEADALANEAMDGGEKQTLFN